MSDTPAQDAPKPAKIDIRKEIAHAEWKDDPVEAVKKTISDNRFQITNEY
jgi:hypothetical protein